MGRGPIPDAGRFAQARIERLTAQRAPGSFPPVTTSQPASAWKGRALTWGPIAVAVAVLAQRSISAVLTRLGHPGAALDDAYIHFQYARAIAEGHPLRFQAGEPITSGATSMLWPTLLAPFWALGARG